MNLNLTKKKWMLAVLFAVFSVNIFAFTAVTSGNWTSSATWGGTAPGSIVSLSDVTIPTGITVTLDDNVEFTGLLNAFTVNGKLTTTTKRLTISQGVLAGSGIIEINRLIFTSVLASSSFSGTVNANTLVNNGSALALAAIVNVEDTLYLEGGSMVLNAGSNLTLKSGSFIVMNGGNLTTSGGVFNSGNDYSVRYEGNSQTTGVELNTSNLQGLYLWLDDSTKTLTLANNLLVNAQLHLRTGSFVINDRQLILKNDVRRMSSSYITSNQNSSIEMKCFTNTTDGLAFTNGSSLNELIIDMQHHTEAKLSSDLRIAGNLKLMGGHLVLTNGAVLTMSNNSMVHVDDGTLLINSGSFASVGAYNVEYLGMADTTGVELLAGGLKDLTVNLKMDNASLILEDDIAVAGQLNLIKGHLHLYGNNLVLNGTFNQMAGAGFIGHSNSELEFNLKSSVNDTVTFSQSNNHIRNLKVNITGGGTVILGSDLAIDNELDLSSGKIELGNYQLIMTSTATIVNYSDNNYIVTSGSGKLRMYVNTSAPFVVFPVGTISSYSPASIQQTSSGTSGDFMVSAMNGVYAQGTSGYNNAVYNSVVNRTWLIESASGVTVNMNLKLAWKNSAEVNGFKRNRAYITHYTNSKWDTYAKAAASASVNNTFELERNGITGLSPFAVADSSSALKIDQVELKADIQLFPNPAISEVHVHVANANHTYSFELLDVTGKVILSSGNTINTHTFNLAGLNNGCYFVRVTDLQNQQLCIQQLIKN